MAVRERPAGFRGGIDRWVTPEQVHELQRQVAALDTAGQLAGWAEAAPLGPFTAVRYLTAAARPALRGEAGAPLTEEGRREAVAVAVVELAARTRAAAIRAHVREHGLDAYVALGGAGTGRGLMRCPHCDAEIQESMNFGHIHCLTRQECQEAQAAEVAELLGAL